MSWTLHDDGGYGWHIENEEGAMVAAHLSEDVARLIVTAPDMEREQEELKRQHAIDQREWANLYDRLEQCRRKNHIAPGEVLARMDEIDNGGEWERSHAMRWLLLREWLEQ